MRNGQNGQKILLFKKPRPLRHTTWRTTWTINGNGEGRTLIHPTSLPRTISGGRMARNLIPLMRRCTQPGELPGPLMGTGKEEPSSTLPHHPAPFLEEGWQETLIPLMRWW
ncbi:hypothetical protein CEXT_158311 [Caerostris extrusa]|uniref:Uncharacterized protein n=1 Tax=Caerostris extrusa TaxID=172846 RepID=A0AAV4PSA2_CAEEX|nr:hypothetical protein CEXT_158311 [Caerostris extrusa]